MVIGITCKYLSWNLLLPSGRCWMSRFGRKGLPLSYVFRQSFDHLMASTFGYFFAGCCLLVMASSEARDGTSLTWFSGLNYSWAYHLHVDMSSLIDVKIGLMVIGCNF
jgi:hypothetical protein